VSRVAPSECAVELRDVVKIYPARAGAGRPVPAVREVSLAIRKGEFFTLLGPSGCGKTTTLRLIAGFETPTSGELLIDGRLMNSLPPNRRPVNTVFQNYALFPHLSVAQNVGFGRALRRLPREERAGRVERALELVRLVGYGGRRTWQLSGGQQQRVALARALANEPGVLLLDEPLGALDLQLRKQMQSELKQLQARLGITFIYVTHDQEEALTMSDRIAVMAGGRVLQLADPLTLYEHPSCRFVAEFIGETNLLEATVGAVQNGAARLQLAGQESYAPLNGTRPGPGERVCWSVRPERLRVLAPEEAGPHALRGRVREAIFIGTDTRLVVALPSGETLVARVQNAGGQGVEQYPVGREVGVCWQPEDVRLLEAAGATPEPATTIKEQEAR
jgi:spermidine/putrescine transport system ATP-binding protein